MTFAQKVKSAMLSARTESACCKKAFLYGILLFAHSFSQQTISLMSENEALLKSVLMMLKTLAKIDLIKVMPLSEAKGGQFRLIVKDTHLTTPILAYFGYSDPYQTDCILSDVFCCPDCKSAFLRGAFLSCGNLVSPEMSYHLEFVLPKPTLTAPLSAFLADCGLVGKVTKRTGHDVIYYKDSEEIIDLLTFTGAHNPVFDFMNTKIEKEIRNACNRVNNCETANLQKTIATAAAQIAAIKALKESGKYEGLSDKLKQTAHLRVENPDVTLGELAKLHEPPITKSCAGHRLNKLTELMETE